MNLLWKYCWQHCLWVDKTALWINILKTCICLLQTGYPYLSAFTLDSTQQVERKPTHKPREGSEYKDASFSLEKDKNAKFNLYVMISQLSKN